LITCHLLYHITHEKAPPGDLETFVKLLEGKVGWLDTPSSIMNKLEVGAMKRLSNAPAIEKRGNVV